MPTRGVPSGAGDTLGDGGGDSSLLHSLDVTPRILKCHSRVPSGADSPWGVAKAEFQELAPGLVLLLQLLVLALGTRSRAGGAFLVLFPVFFSGNGAQGPNRAWGSSCQNDPW